MHVSSIHHQTASLDRRTVRVFVVERFRAHVPVLKVFVVELLGDTDA